ncbi:Ubiquinone biosynthesis O-methyltransferase [Trinorchestia longiramus]|nr:Ubiquinone biosynthesis O-methyltransferase [Trinorchestia longiramus]
MSSSRNLASIYDSWEVASSRIPVTYKSRHYCTVREIPINVESNQPHQPSSNTSNSSFNKEEVRKFDELADKWWVKNGPYKALHSLNTLRVALVRDGIIGAGGGVGVGGSGSSQPLTGTTVLDVGCGGGLLAEPLARLGASVTGLDASRESIEVAECHAQKDLKLQDRLQYVCGDLEVFSQVSENQNYDAVVASEVIEHVDSVESFINFCSKCIKPGGSLFITTINKTPQSFLGAIVAAEYLLGIVPKGTHSWDRFVPVEALKSTLINSGLHIRLLHGMFYMPGLDRWCWIADTSVNYALHAVKG